MTKRLSSSGVIMSGVSGSGVPHPVFCCVIVVRVDDDERTSRERY